VTRCARVGLNGVARAGQRLRFGAVMLVLGLLGFGPKGQSLSLGLGLGLVAQILVNITHITGL